jgi:hypothetical protein
VDSYSPDLHYVSLPTAVAQVLYRLTGQQVDGQRSEQTLALLNDVAHAISNVVSIYAPDSVTSFRALDPIDLLEGRFDRGAMLFRTKDGREFKGLTVQRADMTIAMTVLKAAKADFSRGTR